MKSNLTQIGILNLNLKYERYLAIASPQKLWLFRRPYLRLRLLNLGLIHLTSIWKVWMDWIYSFSRILFLIVIREFVSSSRYTQFRYLISIFFKIPFLVFLILYMFHRWIEWFLLSDKHGLILWINLIISFSNWGLLVIIIWYWIIINIWIFFIELTA